MLLGRLSAELRLQGRVQYWSDSSCLESIFTSVFLLRSDGAQSSLSPNSCQVSIHVSGDRKSTDETFQGWKVVLCLCGVAGVNTLWSQPVFEWHMGPMYSEWTADV